MQSSTSDCEVVVRVSELLFRVSDFLPRAGAGVRRFLSHHHDSLRPFQHRIISVGMRQPRRTEYGHIVSHANFVSTVPSIIATSIGTRVGVLTTPLKLYTTAAMHISDKIHAHLLLIGSSVNVLHMYLACLLGQVEVEVSLILFPASSLDILPTRSFLSFICDHETSPTTCALDHHQQRTHHYLRR